VYPYGYGFDHGRMVERHISRQFEHVPFWEREELLGSASRLESHHLEFFADVVHAVAAWIAFAAHDLRCERYFVAYGNPFDILADGDGHAGNLVSLNHWIAGIRVHPVEYMDIRSADANAFGLHQDFVIFERRFLNLTKHDLARFYHNCLFHFRLCLYATCCRDNIMCR